MDINLHRISLQDLAISSIALDTYLMKLRTLSIFAIAIALVTAGLNPAGAAEKSTSVLPAWAKSSTIYEVNIRQYSEAGNFDGVTTQLPRLKKLGVDILWVMPIQPISQLNRKGVLGSPYSIADYKGINPEFGTSEDFKKFVSAAHQQGMKVVLDWVANHSGWDNPWIKNKGWYHTDEKGNVVPPNADWSDVAWLNYDNKDMRAAMLDAMSYWVTTFDIDGFRADVAGGVPVDFWNSANASLQKIKPLFMLAEEQGTEGMLDQAFVTNYNWALKDYINQLAKGAGNNFSFEFFADNNLAAYPAGSMPMNFITNHDENSWNGSEFRRLEGAVSAMAALTFTYPGIPLIYSGQEVGNTKELAFFEKDLIPNLNTENSTTAFYKKLVSLKKKNPSIWNNAKLEMTFLPTTSSSVIAFVRGSGTNKVITLINISESVQKSTIKTGKNAGNYVLFSNGKKVKVASSLAISLKPWQFEIYSTSGQ